MVKLPTQNPASQVQHNGSLVDEKKCADELLAEELDAQEQNFKPLTRLEAERIRAANPPASIARVVGVQVVTSMVVAVLAWLVSGKDAMGWSALYGGLAVWVPAALVARGLQRQKAAGDAGSALMGFFVWELVKIMLTVAMLLAAPRLVSELNWLALLAGFVVTMKVYWVAMWLHLVRKNSVSKVVDKTAQKNG